MATASGGTSTGKTAQSELVKSIIRQHHRTPIAYYQLKDRFIDVVGNPNFLDGVLLLIGFLAVVTAFPFYPIALIALLMIGILVVTLYHPFLGLIAFMALIYPAIAYQVPPIAWFFMMVISLSLILGYMHYRTLAFAYILLAMAFSPLGYFLSIPLFIMSVLIVGYKRAIVLAAVLVLGVVMFSGMTGVHNSAYINYDPQPAFSQVSHTQLDQYVVPDKPALTLLNFTSGAAGSLATFTSGGVISSVGSVFSAVFIGLSYHTVEYAVDLAVIVALVFAIDMLAVNLKTKYKGAYASLVGALYPALYITVSIAFGSTPSLILPIVSFMMAPALLYVLELYNIDIVKALEVRKQDIRLRFGEAFEDLQSENIGTKFADIGNYDATKRELYDAVVAPIEQRGISRAYNVKPAKGILLFGPPGTGKTMLMRALANEIRAGFYLVKASTLISAFPGETERQLTNIFSVARKNSPDVLFIDEIDSLARSRELESDETHRQALSQLLIELDGFQKISNVVVVGATNTPQLIDPAIMRPGRFDKIVYMPLPDFNGRKAIFKIYLKKLPVGDDVDVAKLAEKTERYSGADIQALVENVAQVVAQEAANMHKVLAISQEDLLTAIRAAKPSTSLSQLEEYNKFRIDFERRFFSEENVEKTEQIGIDDVIGLDDAKKAIVEAIEIPLMHPDLIKKYAIKPINGLLLFGPPGTGKTMLMRAVSNEMKGVTMLEMKGAELVSQDRDRAIATIKEVFNRALENVPSIIFVDEIDTIVPRREGATERGVQVTGEMLDEIDGIRKSTGVVVIAATNRPDSLDPALIRAGRFDKMIFIRPPNPDERASLFRMYLKGVPIAKDMDFKRLGDVSKGYTGADIANVCREVKTRALSASIKSGEEMAIGQSDIESVIQGVRPSAPDTAISGYLTFLARYGQR